jgi:WG containing repeat
MAHRMMTWARTRRRGQDTPIIGVCPCPSGNASPDKLENVRDMSYSVRSFCWSVKSKGTSVKEIPAYYLHLPFERLIGLALAVSALSLSSNSAPANDTSSTKQWKTTRQTGQLVIPASFDFCWSFNDGRAAVLVDGKWGWIAKSGQFVIEPSYDQVDNFYNGVAPVHVGGENGKWGLINSSGNFVVNPRFDSILGPINGIYSVFIEKKNYYIDSSGNISNGWEKRRYNTPMPQFSESDGKYGFVDDDHNFVIPPRFDRTQGGFSEGLAAVCKGQCAVDEGPWGFIDTKGHVVIDFQFGSAYDFSDGLAPVRVGDEKSGKWGYINKSGQFIINPRYDDAADFSEGLAEVLLGHKFGFIDKSGNVIIAPRFDTSPSVALSFTEGLAPVAIDGKCGYIAR